MIQKQTKLKITDNSGIKLVRVFHLYKYSLGKNSSSSGDLVLGSVLSYKSNKKITKKQIYQVLITTVKKNNFRKNGNFIKFDENRGITFSDFKKLVGSRIFGPISKEMKCSSYCRLLTLVTKIV